MEETEHRSGGFAAHEIRWEGQPLSYLLHAPAQAAGEYPLMLYLHSDEERMLPLSELTACAGSAAFAAAEWQEEQPCFVCVPLCPAGAAWTDDNVYQMLMAAVAKLSQDDFIDSNRIYISGTAQGATGCWNLLARNADLFAAAMPVGGAGVPKDMMPAKNVPLWAFHAAADARIPVSICTEGNLGRYGTRRMVSALRGTGNRQVKYTEYVDITAAEAANTAFADKAAKKWLFTHSLKQRYKIEQLMPGVWQMLDYFNACFFLVEGEDKAVLIDTGLGENVLELVQSLTKLPVELALTHVHYDHMFHSHLFGQFYLSKKELPIMPIYKELMPGNTSTEADIIDICEGDKIDLGGTVLEVLELNGHSPGSLTFVDRAHKLCFMGDAVGSGEFSWMQIPGALDLSVYKRNLEHFLQWLKDEDLEDITLLGGHYKQQWNWPENTAYNPVSIELIADMATLCGLILEDKVALGTSDISMTNEVTLTASYGAATIYFREENRK